MVACTLAEGRYVLRSVPEISDVHHMCGVLHALGMTTQRRDDGALEVVRGAEVLPEAPAELVERMRASTALIGPLLAATGRVRLSLPGGDDFGTRPIEIIKDGRLVKGLIA
jgi:UDP-N-acetylglucosamine 1-carboxyvinyltransferase